MLTYILTYLAIGFAIELIAVTILLFRGSTQSISGAVRTVFLWPAPVVFVLISILVLISTLAFEAFRALFIWTYRLRERFSRS